MTASERAEQIKQKHKFDQGLVDVIVPVSHSLRDKAMFRDQLVMNIQRLIDPTFADFLGKGCKKIRWKALTGRPYVRVRRRFSARPELRAYVMSFLMVYFEETSKGRVKDKARLNDAANQSVDILTELIRRSQMARLLTE